MQARLIMMGNLLCLGQASIRAVCDREWNLYTQYIDENGSRRDEQQWEMILDDLHHLDIETTSIEISTHFTDVVETILLGCKEVVSRDIHDQFAEIIVKRVKEIIELDSDVINTQFNQVINLFRSTEDSQRDRETSVVFVMAIRLMTAKRQEAREEDTSPPAPTIKWESCFRIRLHSRLINRPVSRRAQTPRRCTLNHFSWSLPATIGHQTVARLDPT